MKHVIIGTAGHVDHGKTALVKALTGIDTDRLEEEKRRGVTIEPGFAYIDFEDGSRAGIIDVPGHERFIRNMLAGSGGVDLAMLVVAADEGVMPQTREHLGILTQLGISDGVVVITKTDKVEPDWLELVTEDIAQLNKGSFLEGKPLLFVSAHTGDGLPALKTALYNLLGSVSEKNAQLPFRLPVDRVFPVDGFGIVVTGTLIEGSVKVGDVAEILPLNKKAPVRNIQVHGENAQTAYAGQRTAISLAGVKRGLVRRGDVIAAEGAINVTEVVDIRLNVLQDTKRTIKHGAELHLYHGARTMLAKAVLIDSRELHHGESCYARLILKEPLPCRRGDRFVVRFYSPLETIGGGVILDTLPGDRISRRKPAIDALKTRENGNAEEIAALTADQLGGVFTEKDLCRRADIDKSTFSEVTEKLAEGGRIMRLLPGKFISAKTQEVLGEKCKILLSDYHASFPLRAGMNIAELRQKLLPGAGTDEAGAVLNALRENGIINLIEKTAAMPNFATTYTPEQSRVKEELLAKLSATGYDAPSPDELTAMFEKNGKREFEQVFESMISNGELIILSPQVFWLRTVYEKAIVLIREHFENNNEITLAQCRDLLSTSRKYALALLEHLDGKQATQMHGDARRLFKGL